jgi:cytochrome c oxidase subunit III
MADSHAKPNHDYHLVDPSPWPALASLGAFMMAVGAITWMRSTGGGSGLALPVVGTIKGSALFWAGAVWVCGVAFLWWRDVIREAHKGDHTPVVQLHLRYGMILFIASEVMFFVAWFWAYFDVSLFPADVFGLPIHDGGVVTPSDKVIIGMESRAKLTGGHWPPAPVATTEMPVSGFFKGTFDPWGLPFINTVILLLSGTTVTWAHHALLKDDRRGLIWGLACTVVLGMLFTACQAYEYAHAGFSYAGHIYGSTFFMATGFHGAHVVIGTIFLFVCLLRALAGHFTSKQHFGFEAAAWYWHFVDVVWLFLFAVIYVYGAGTPLAH